jgi:tripartite-type tricarboxylate transporter receptor subunit TctC
MKNTLLTFLLSAFMATSASAAQVVPIVWPFAPGSQQANYVRAIAEEANTQQTKYTFVFESKPGAGGSIAARYISNHHSLAIMSSSSSFFVRPEFYPNESHSVANYKPVLIQCTGQPFSILGSKYKTLDEVRKQKSISIGINNGSIVEAIAREFKNHLPNTDLLLVPYPGTLQATVDTLGGNVDLTIDLPADTLQHIDAGKLTVIGSTGTIENKNYPTFSKQGLKGFEGLTVNYHMVVPVTTDPVTTRELHDILRKASNTSKSLKPMMAADLCNGVDADFAKTNEIFDQWVKYWPAKLKTLK